jgi:hypothetical protein
LSQEKERWFTANLCIVKLISEAMAYSPPY